MLVRRLSSVLHLSPRLGEFRGPDLDRFFCGARSSAVGGRGKRLACAEMTFGFGAAAVVGFLLFRASILRTGITKANPERASHTGAAQNTNSSNITSPPPICPLHIPTGKRNNASVKICSR